jgi:hypothetical protein
VNGTCQEPTCCRARQAPIPASNFELFSSVLCCGCFRFGMLPMHPTAWRQPAAPFNDAQQPYPADTVRRQMHDPASPLGLHRAGNAVLRSKFQDGATTNVGRQQPDSEPLTASRGIDETGTSTLCVSSNPSSAFWFAALLCNVPLTRSVNVQQGSADGRGNGGCDARRQPRCSLPSSRSK